VKRPRLVLSDAAVADILEQSDWYQEQSGDKLAAMGECGNVSCLARCENAPAPEHYASSSRQSFMVYDACRLLDSQNICSSMNSRRRRYLFSASSMALAT